MSMLASCLLLRGQCSFHRPSPPKNEPVRDLADDDSGNEVDYETSLVREEANNDLHEV